MGGFGANFAENTNEFCGREEAKRIPGWVCNCCKRITGSDCLPLRYSNKNTDEPGYFLVMTSTNSKKPSDAIRACREIQNTPSRQTCSRGKRSLAFLSAIRFKSRMLLPGTSFSSASLNCRARWMQTKERSYCLALKTQPNTPIKIRNKAAGMSAIDTALSRPITLSTPAVSAAKNPVTVDRCCS
jgi:hypothetical protein